MSNYNYCCIRKPHEQSKTSFGVPKIESERNKWEESLGMTLKKSHRICLQHDHYICNVHYNAYEAIFIHG